VTWVDEKRAQVSVAGAKSVSALASEAPLEYLVGETGQWKAVPTWTVPQLDLPLGSGETVVAVRYGGGDQPGALRSLTALNDQPAGLLPSFTAHRDVVTGGSH
jgi:hypothetical protein